MNAFAPKKAAWVIIFFGLIAGVLSGSFIGLVYDLPEINHLKQFKPSLVTQVFSADNQLISRFYLEKRFFSPIEKMPASLILAVIATEDRDFFSHVGINLKAITRAIVHDLKAGRFKQGASTLTQQLAKTLFLSAEKSIVRKIREAILAIQIERRYTKNEILELYLNQIYLGSGAYGVEAAARTYFNTSVTGLTLGQAALIAGLPKAPSSYSPLNHPDLARKRRNIVLTQMLTLGQISQDEYAAAIQEPVASPPEQRSNRPALYFRDYVKNQMAQLDLAHDTAGGLSIHTTLDLGLQRTAEHAVEQHLARLDQRMRENGVTRPAPQAALVALDVHSGAILAMVGGRRFKQSPYNRAVQARRQPGSAFKPLVYATALAQGYDQDSVLIDAPLSYTLPGSTTWTVENFSKSFLGRMTFRKALALSKNTPVVRLMEHIGPESVMAFARKAGIQSTLPPHLSLALGAGEVSLLELTSAYACFAAQGIRAVPFAIDRITDREGQSIYQHSVQKQSVTDRISAAITADMLKAVIQEGTGRQARVIQKEIGGKTGTTDNYKDALFVGISPETACGVWVGNDNNDTLGPHETGARAALPIWTDFMKAALAGHTVHYFDIPDGTQQVYIHSDSGKRAHGPGPGIVRALVRTDVRTPG